MKKLISIVTLTCMLLSFSGCGEPKPSATVEKYFSAAQKMDVEAMAMTIASYNTEDLEETRDLLDEENQDDYTKYFLEYLKQNAAKMTYTITGSEVDGDNAVVTVDCKYIDGGALLKATIGEVFMKMFGMAFSGVELTEEETGQMFVSVMQEQSELLDETYLENTINVNLIKEDGDWAIAEVNDEMVDVVMSGFISAGEEIAESFNSIGN